MAKSKASKQANDPIGVEEDVLSEEDRARFNTEWATLSALRELAHIALRTNDPPTYRRVIQLGEKLLPGIFSIEERIIDKAPESIEARYYREKSIAETIKRNKPTSAVTIISEDIEALEESIRINPESIISRSKLNTLHLVRQELSPTRHTEHELIFRDAIVTGIDLDMNGSGQKYTEYKLPENRALRVNIYHPDAPEHKTGADLVYEIYDLEAKTAQGDCAMMGNLGK